MAADRGPFIDQSQSLNVHMAKPTPDKLTSMHFYGWQMVQKMKKINIKKKIKMYKVKYKKIKIL